jgi:hypothetical protein
MDAKFIPSSSITSHPPSRRGCCLSLLQHVTRDRIASTNSRIGICISLLIFLLFSQCARLCFSVASGAAIGVVRVHFPNFGDDERGGGQRPATVVVSWPMRALSSP